MPATSSSGGLVVEGFGGSSHHQTILLEIPNTPNPYIAGHTGCQMPAPASGVLQLVTAANSSRESQGYCTEVCVWRWNGVCQGLAV
jgi:hypothetical protein